MSGPVMMSQDEFDAQNLVDRLEKPGALTVEEKMNDVLIQLAKANQDLLARVRKLEEKTTYLDWRG